LQIAIVYVSPTPVGSEKAARAGMQQVMGQQRLGDAKNDFGKDETWMSAVGYPRKAENEKRMGKVSTCVVSFNRMYLSLRL
jgi:hypothetical protein